MYLAHHGILGQKWGIRRYQNPDGSLTEAGRRRYTKQFGKFEKQRQADWRAHPSRSAKKAIAEYDREKFDKFVEIENRRQDIERRLIDMMHDVDIDLIPDSIIEERSQAQQDSSDAGQALVDAIYERYKGASIDTLYHLLISATSDKIGGYRA